MIIEFSGTPGAGKSTLERAVASEYSNRTIVHIQDTPSPLPCRADGLDLTVLWTMLDTYRQINTDDIEKKDACILASRGAFDRIAWATLFGQLFPEQIGTAERFRDLFFDSSFFKRTDLIVLLLTSFNQIVERKPQYRHESDANGNLHLIVNSKMIDRLNRIYVEQYNAMSGDKRILLIDDRLNEISLNDKIAAIQQAVKDCGLIAEP